MHFDLTVSLGNLVTIGALLIAIIRWDRKLARYDVEHEMLIGWYCKSHNMRVRDLPTRSHQGG